MIYILKKKLKNKREKCRAKFKSLFEKFVELYDYLIKFFIVDFHFKQYRQKIYFILYTWNNSYQYSKLEFSRFILKIILNLFPRYFLFLYPLLFTLLPLFIFVSSRESNHVVKVSTVKITRGIIFRTCTNRRCNFGICFSTSV